MHQSKSQTREVMSKATTGRHDNYTRLLDLAGAFTFKNQLLFLYLINASVDLK